jgi:riboflavin synthase
MFTGIVEGIGKIKKISKATKNRSAIQMVVNLGKYGKAVKTGQSVALNGVCLTVTKGGIVNIERSLKAGDRLEGHFVLGHVDGVGIIKKIQKKPKEVQVWFEVPKSLSKFIVKKGSIAMDGISLTVVDIKNNLASICLIPHTIEVTNFKTKNIGDKVNIETDILGKYILK